MDLFPVTKGEAMVLSSDGVVVDLFAVEKLS